MSATSDVHSKVEQLKAGKIVPDVVKAFSAEFLDLRVFYNEVEVANGLKMTRAQTQIRPHVQFHCPSAVTDIAMYTLLMVDPDAPSPDNPKFRSFLHWIVVNIPGSTALSKEIWETGIEVTPYTGPKPPDGPHRYIFLLYKQKEELNLAKVEERPKFNVEDFTKTHDLGNPVGGTYYIATPND